MCAMREWTPSCSCAGNGSHVRYCPSPAKHLVVVRHGEGNIDMFRIREILEVGRFQTRLIQSLNDSAPFLCLFVGSRLYSGISFCCVHVELEIMHTVEIPAFGPARVLELRLPVVIPHVDLEPA